MIKTLVYTKKTYWYRCSTCYREVETQHELYYGKITKCPQCGTDIKLDYNSVL